MNKLLVDGTGNSLFIRQKYQMLKQCSSMVFTAKKGRNFNISPFILFRLENKSRNRKTFSFYENCLNGVFKDPTSLKWNENEDERTKYWNDGLSMKHRT